jgi:hypothetical protein
MVYQFYIKASWHDADAFVRFAESLKSTVYIGIDFSIANNKVPNGLINILCNEKDYKECFWWLKGRKITARVVKTAIKEYKSGRSSKI